MRFPIITRTRDVSAFNRFFDDFKPLLDSSLFCDESKVMLPAVNVSEDDSAFYIEVEASRMKKEDFSISVENKVLSISGKRTDTNENEGKTYFRKEIVSGSFSRSFQIPENVDSQAITATHENGVLELKLPKTPKDQDKVQNIRVE